LPCWGQKTPIIKTSYYHIRHKSCQYQAIGKGVRRALEAASCSNPAPNCAHAHNRDSAADRSPAFTLRNNILRLPSSATGAIRSFPCYDQNADNHGHEYGHEHAGWHGHEYGYEHGHKYGHEYTYEHADEYSHKHADQHSDRNTYEFDLRQC
jgi:hypothetical protein